MDFNLFQQKLVDIGVKPTPAALKNLTVYYRALREWQQKVNLVSSATMVDAWERHFLDSAQLLSLLPKEEGPVITDIGCGAGFPGLVLKMLRPDIFLNCVESDNKKCQFLRHVSRETNTQITVYNKRIEDIYRDVRPDVLVARALSDLSQLLRYMEGFATKKAIFLKGARWKQELPHAEDLYDFNIEVLPSITNVEARVLVITDLKKCG